MINSRQVIFHILRRVIPYNLFFFVQGNEASYWITENAIPLWETIIGSLKWNESLAKPYMRKFDNYFTQLRIVKGISF